MNLCAKVKNTVLQKLQLSPQMLASLKMLKLSQLDLIDTIQKELSDNPFLTEVKKSNIAAARDQSTGDPKSKSLMNGSNYMYSTSSIIEKCVASRKTLSEHLLSQLRLNYSDDSAENYAGQCLISSLDKDGYMSRIVLREIFIHLKNNKLVAKVMRKIQTFDPYGICSRDTKEALFIQLNILSKKENTEKYKIEQAIIKNHLQLLAKKRFTELAKKLKTTEKRIENAYKNIKALAIKPAYNFSHVPTQFIAPDILLEKSVTTNEDTDFENMGFKITIQDNVLPTIKINKEYISYFKTGDIAFRQFLHEKHGSAVNLLNFLKYRKTNLQKVAECLFAFQSEYFFKGPEFLKPITITVCAEMLGMSEGTLSRLVCSKYIQTPWGIKPLRYFFSIPIKQEFESLSSTMIKEHIKNMINKSVFQASDKQLAFLLKEREICISRRTVAKYRKQMQIANSYERLNV